MSAPCSFGAVASERERSLAKKKTVVPKARSCAEPENSSRTRPEHTCKSASIHDSEGENNAVQRLPLKPTEL
jgi:hypothetical protein